ncbi:MAG: hypothetical protein Q7J31_17730 [Syntrophales bacterium]|nr:hypothetical protein [Syntrophales bacterium]
MNIKFNYRTNFLLFTPGAKSVNIKLVAMDQKTVIVGYCLLKILNRLIFKFGDLSAFRADKMVVVFPFGNLLVTGLSVAEMDIVGDPGTGKKLQGAAHRGVPYARMFSPDFPIEFLYAHVPARGEKEFKDYIPLPGRPEPFP